MDDHQQKSRTPDESIIKRVNLRVRDLPRAIDFYQDVVGLRVLESSSQQAILGVPESPDEVLLGLVESPDAPRRPRASAGLFHIAFRVPDQNALADALRRITDHHRLTGASDHKISHALYLNDPEGNGLEIYCDNPRDQWPIDAQGRIQLATERLDLQALLAHAPTETPERFPAGTDVGHIHLEGLDIGDAHRFYTELLGLNVMAEAPSVLFTAQGDYHHHVGINTWNRRATPHDNQATGLISIEANLASTDADDVLARSHRLGFEATHKGEALAIRDANNIEWICQAG